MNTGPDSASPARFGFLLLNEFTLISLSSAVEPLRMANRVCQQDHYSWKTLSESGAAVTASDGLSINVDGSILGDLNLQQFDVIVVCGGLNIESNVSKPVLNWLRKAAQQKLALGAICTGSHALAAAGLLDGYRSSIHWENLAAMTNQFPKVIVSRSVFSIDRDRYTSSGGTAPLDMMLHLISARCGGQISAAVAEQFISERIRRPTDQQRIPLRHEVGRRSGKLVLAVEFMEANIHEPIGMAELAGLTGLSLRQLQRLFSQHLRCKPSQYYLKLRLQRARELFQQTQLGLAEIAELTGFESASRLSRKYKARYGKSPGKDYRTEPLQETNPG
jgi:transcriptional regulator GlxA family with amidase domain